MTSDNIFRCLLCAPLSPLINFRAAAAPWNALKNPSNIHSINCVGAMNPVPPPLVWGKADLDDALSEQAVWGNPILSLPTQGTTEDSWAHIKLSLCSHVETNERASCGLEVIISVKNNSETEPVPSKYHVTLLPSTVTWELVESKSHFLKTKHPKKIMSSLNT